MGNTIAFNDLPHWRLIIASLLVLALALPFYIPFILVGYALAYGSKIGVKYALLLGGGLLLTCFFAESPSHMLPLVVISGSEFWSSLLLAPDADLSTAKNLMNSIEFAETGEMIDWYQRHLLADKAFWLYFSLGGAIGCLLSVWSYCAYKSPLKSIGKAKDNEKSHSFIGNVGHDLINARSASVTDGTVLGSLRNGSASILTDKDANKHTLLLGASGSGKTVTMCNIIESAIDRGLPTIIIDGKGDRTLGKQICQYGHKKGRNVFYLAFGDIQSNCLYDPFYSGDYTSKTNRIIGLRTWSDDYYEGNALNYLQKVFQVLDYLDVNTDLDTICHYLLKPNLIKLIKEHGLDKDVQEGHKVQLERFLTNISNSKIEEKEIASIIASISNFSDSTYGQHFIGERNGNKKTLRLYDVINNGDVVYIGLPNLSSRETSALLGKLVVNDIKATMEKINNQKTHNLEFLGAESSPSQLEDDAEPNRSYIFFDEFSVFAGEQSLNLVNQARSFGVHCVFSTQTLSDISAASNKGKELAQQFIGNCYNVIVQAGIPSADAQLLADQLGTKPASAFTTQIGASGSTGMGSARDTRKYYLHPDDIKKLAPQTAYHITGKSHEFIKARYSHIVQETIR